ncbi:MAG: DUF5057 domain-containing protein [Lachnospiraceae bacterium]|nr:DUF5057 domain-containing protein [Lachnospiraceae bacterium]
MKRNKKLTISALAVLLVMALTVTVVSFSLAGNDNKGELVDEAVFVAATVDTNTNIDNIIENSYMTGEGTDPVYKIVEIGSGAPSSLKTLVESGGFENYVINGNTTLDSITITDPTGVESITAAVMNAECITYEFYKASDVTDDNATALAAISNADFIYVSNDESSKYSQSNDLGEELYNILHTYAVGDYKPLVIDNIGSTGGSSDEPGGSTGTTYSMSSLVNKVFDRSGKYYYTFKWDTTAQTAEQFFAHQNGSAYLGINGDKKSSKWTEVTLAANITDGVLAEGAETYKMAEVLVISNGTQTLAPAIFADLGASYGGSIVDMTGTALTGDIYDIKNGDAGTLFYNSAYNARYARPEMIRVKEILLADVATEDLDKYDMVIIEPDCNVDIDQAVYKKLGSAMYASVSIVYPATFSTSSGSGNGSGTSAGNGSVQQETNYSELFYMVATSTGQVRYENVMITNKTEFDFIALSNSSATCKVIADLINASAFRGNGGPKGSANKFTVLEIQPCYPIDEDLAAAQKDYYKIPSDVVNGKTKEELDEGTEYYAWEITKPMIAEAFNISADQINIVHMSTEQLASTKEEILGNYDLVYVGGNISALKPARHYASYGMPSMSTNFEKLNMTVDSLKKLPIYEMYSHTGELVETNFGALGEASGTVLGNIPTGYVNINGTMQKSYGVLNGNDITTLKLTHLQEYVEAGMPIVFSNDVSVACDAVINDGYFQNSIDPDSNMFKFMKYCKDLGAVKNIKWNFDNKQLVDVDNNGGDYGDTQTGYVKVFAEAQSDELQDLYAKSDKRPKITLTQTPYIYNMYDDATIIKNKKLTFQYKVTGSTNYTVDLYVDDDGNSTFETKVASGDKEKLEFTAGDSFFGPVYWKLVVTDKSGQEASTTGISYIANSSTSKQKVRILQIMPGEFTKAGVRNATAGETAQGKNSLYFCTICQQAYERLEYNPSAESGDRLDYTALYDGRMVDHEGGYSYQGAANKKYLGLHEHEFGIVKYESSRTAGQYVGADNWDLNLADEVRDKYDFDIEIMMRSEFVDLSNAIAAANDVENLTEEEKTALTDGYEKSMADALKEYTALNSLIKYTDADMEKAFVDYQYLDELKLEMGTLSADDKTASGLTMSAIDAEIDLRTALMHMRDELGAGTFQGQEIHRLLTTRHYWDYYSTQNGKYCWPEDNYTTAQGENINTLYQTYIKLSDQKILADQDYKLYSRYLSGTEWMFDSFDMVVIGASEDFANDDFVETGSTQPAVNALADLEYYLSEGGSILMFHDTVTRFEDAGSVYLTKLVRKYSGMDRFNMEIDATKTDNLAASYLVPYTSTDPDKYFMTDLSVAGSTSTGANKYKNWLSETTAIFKENYGWYTPKTLYVTDEAYTDSTWITSSTGAHDGQMPYKYSEIGWAIAAIWARDDQTYIKGKTSGDYGADKASRTNEGVVTLYPFTLADQLNVSFTHAQAYALDLENEDITVWYSMGGGTGNKKGSSVYAASPNDGMDSYFIYTYENFNYCGAGHCNVTGVWKDNNDERRLYINIICNSVKKSIAQPDILVYDYNTTDNKVIKKNGDIYVTKVDTAEEYPEFSFLARLDEDAQIERVRIYYDLDYLTTNLDAYKEDEYHKLIADWTREQVIEGMLKNVFRYDSTLKVLFDENGKAIEETYVDEKGDSYAVYASMLKLQPSYFDPYNGQYTYIVIEVTDTEGNVAYKRIKIQLKDKLFNLT